MIKIFFQVSWPTVVSAVVVVASGPSIVATSVAAAAFDAGDAARTASFAY